jgi:glycosyltransferase involved in cell wall biosynthesis
VSINGITGFTVPIKDEIAIAGAINRLFHNASLYATFSQNDLDRVAEFNEKNMVSAYIKFYNDCF